MTTRDRLDQIRARTNAATNGPWWPFDHTHDIGFEIAVGEPEPDGYPAEKLPNGFKTDIGRREDAEFIAHARQDVPWLLDLLDKLEKLTADDLLPGFTVQQCADNGQDVGVVYLAGAHAALGMVRERIADAAKEQP